MLVAAMSFGRAVRHSSGSLLLRNRQNLVEWPRNQHSGGVVSAIAADAGNLGSDEADAGTRGSDNRTNRPHNAVRPVSGADPTERPPL